MLKQVFCERQKQPVYIHVEVIHCGTLEKPNKSMFGRVSCPLSEKFSCSYCSAIHTTK